MNLKKRTSIQSPLIFGKVDGVGIFTKCLQLPKQGFFVANPVTRSMASSYFQPSIHLLHALTSLKVLSELSTHLTALRMCTLLGYALKLYMKELARLSSTLKHVEVASGGVDLCLINWEVRSLDCSQLSHSMQITCWVMK
jgi:hypothetical protein